MDGSWCDPGKSDCRPTKLAGHERSREAVKPVGGGMNMSLKDAKLWRMINDRGTPVLLVFPKMATGNWSDEDWGSAGPACIFSIGVCVATGKDGIAYPIKTANLGGTTSGRPGQPEGELRKTRGASGLADHEPGPGRSLSRPIPRR